MGGISIALLPLWIVTTSTQVFAQSNAVSTLDSCRAERHAAGPTDLGSLTKAIDLAQQKLNADLWCNFSREPAIAKAAKLAKDLDYLGKDFDLVPAKSEDCRTIFGTVIDHSCFMAGVSDKQSSPDVKRHVVELIEKTIADTIIDTQRCTKAIFGADLNKPKGGFPALYSIVPTLRRTRIICDHSGGVTDAAVRTTGGKYIAGRAAYDSSGNHHTTTLPSATLIADPATERASVLFHETTHHLPLNNKNWHNSASEKSSDRCSNSIFVDRVYLLQATCTPRSMKGMAFYGLDDYVPKKLGINSFPYSCSKYTCERALIEVDKAAADSYGDLTAHPHSKREAESLCSKIIDARDRYEALKNQLDGMKKLKGLSYLDTKIGKGKNPELTRMNSEIEDLTRRLFKDKSLTKEEKQTLETKIDAMTEALQEASKKKKPNGSEYEDLSIQVKAYVQKIRQMYFVDESERKTLRLVLVNLETKISGSIAQTCAQIPPPTGWGDFCTLKGSPILDELKQHAILVSDLKPHDGDLLRLFSGSALE